MGQEKLSQLANYWAGGFANEEAISIQTGGGHMSWRRPWLTAEGQKSQRVSRLRKL
jgi:hypothetical protein